MTSRKPTNRSGTNEKRRERAGCLMRVLFPLTLLYVASVHMSCMRTGRDPGTDDPISSSSSLPSPYSSAANTRRKTSINGFLKRRSSTSLPSLPASKGEQLCALVTQALKQHHALIPIHLDVQDVSCAQLQYRLLGTKRYWYRSIKQEKQGAKRWEIKLYEVRCRKSTLDALVAHLHWGCVERLASADSYLKPVGFFDTEKAAISACDAAFKAREVTNPLTGCHVTKMPLPDELVQFFQIQIVSESFQRRSHRERLRLVYEVLLDKLTGVDADEKDDIVAVASLPPSPLAVGGCEGGDSSSLPRMRGFSGCVGDHVARLPLWRFLNVHFAISAMTPTQWRPGSKTLALMGDTERYGASHLANDRALGINPSLLPVSRGLAELVSLNQEDLQARTKSVLPHFYHGLPDELKRMIAEEQAKADQVLLHGAAGGHQKLLKNTESSFVKKYMKRRREYAQVALRLQRSLRMNSQGKVLREIFQRQRGSIAIQRIVRGHRTRKYVRAYFRVMTCAALIVQSVYRSYVSRQQTTALRHLMAASALTIQRVYQGHLGRKYVRWVRWLASSATAVQRVIRGFMARQRVKRIRKARYRLKIVVPACQLIQRVWRGCRARQIAKEKRALREKLEVLHPAALRIERLLRGYLARCLAVKFRAASKAALQIQKFWRKLRYYKKWMDLMVLRKQDRRASKIGAIGRGYVARKFFQREKRKRYLKCVLQPAAVQIQRVFRSHMVRKYLEELRDQTEAAITLQQMWRKRSKIKTIQDKLCGFRIALRNARASQIQRSYRCYRARQQLVYLQMSYQARYGKAAVAIQSAWRSHCSREQLKEFRFCSLIERKARALTQWKESREMIDFDLLDARADLKRVIKYKAKSLRRIKELKDMRIEWERRQPVVDKELSDLTEEDLDRGWGEAFQTEKHILHYSLELSVEDILSHKQQVREYDSEIDDLRLELEDLERDLEECILGETVELEAYRELELSHARRMFANERVRKIRLQRIRWRVKSDRKSIVLRGRNDLHVIEKQHLAKRQVQDLGVLSFEKKQMMQQRLEQAIEKAAICSSQQNLLKVELKRDANIVEGLNQGIHKMKTIVDEYSFEYRLTKADVRKQQEFGGVPSPMCPGCGRMTCDCGTSQQSADQSKQKSMKGRASAGVGLSDGTLISNNNNLAPRNDRLARRPKYQD